MEEIHLVSQTQQGLSNQEIKEALVRSLEGRSLKKVLIVPPDFTRFHSNAGLITNLYYHLLQERGCQVHIMPALGTHHPMSREQVEAMFGDIPFQSFIPHNWRTDVLALGQVPASFISEATGGLWREPVTMEINRRIMDDSYDLIISLGQVVPHEVVGMSNHAKNLFVGVGGSEVINKSHMIGAVYGMERMMGRDHTPVRKLFDYGMEHFLCHRPILFVLTVTTAPQGSICTHGLFVGEGRHCLTEAIELSQQKNIDFVDRGIKKCVVYLDPREFRSTWLGNKAVYRTRMAMADGGQLIVLAPGVSQFGEDAQVDALIRQFGYKGTAAVMEAFEREENKVLRDNMGAAAHLIHGSSEGRFSITYAVEQISQQEIDRVGYIPASYRQLAARYDPLRLKSGYNTMEDGEEVFFIPNPALGLWIHRQRFANLKD